MSDLSQQVTSSQRAGVNTAVSALNVMFSGFEKIADLNLKVMRSALDEMAQTSQKAIEVNDPQEAFACASAWIKPNADKMLSYGKNVYDIMTGVQSDLVRLNEKQIAGSQQQISEAIEHFAKNAPTGSESAVALLKSSFATVNSAYDSMQRATRQASQVAENNLNAATHATINATNEVADAVDKAANVARNRR